MHEATTFACFADAGLPRGAVGEGLGISFIAAGLLLTLGIIAGGWWAFFRLEGRPVTGLGCCALAMLGGGVCAVASFCGLLGWNSPDFRELRPVALVLGAVGAALLGAAGRVASRYAGEPARRTYDRPDPRYPG